MHYHTMHKTFDKSEWHAKLAMQNIGSMYRISMHKDNDNNNSNNNNIIINNNQENCLNCCLDHPLCKEAMMPTQQLPYTPSELLLLLDAAADASSASRAYTMSRGLASTAASPPSCYGPLAE
eukprot:1146856-Pelagomonas_calceolata.AAC.6